MFKHVILSNQKLHIERNKMLNALAQSIKIMYVFSYKRHRNEVFVLYVCIISGMNLEVLIRETRDAYLDNSRSIFTSSSLNLRRGKSQSLFLQNFIFISTSTVPLLLIYTIIF